MKGLMRHTTVLFLLLAGGLSLVLFSVKYQVQDMQDRRVELEHRLAQAYRDIHVLKAEWAHLNDPVRLMQLAEAHLELTPVRPGQLGVLDASLTVAQR